MSDGPAAIIFDETGTNAAAVKAASTAAVAADKALVVCVSPNNSIAVTGTLTDAQLRATPVPVSGTVTANAGTGPWPVTDNAGSLTIDSAQLPAALVGGRLDENVGAWLGSTAPTIGQKTMADSLPVVFASNQSSITVTGPLTDAQLRATPVPVSGTVTANIGTTNGLALDASITAQSLVDNAAFTDGTTRVQPIAFILDETGGTALTENDAAAARIDSKRAQVLVIEDATTRGIRTTVKAASTAAAAADPALVVAVSPNNVVAVTTAPTASTPGFTAGDVTTAATTETAVRSTAYNEQSSNAQRSIVSTSVNDTAAGTGVRSVEITYLTSTSTGPFTETVTLNGTTPVNTVATNICFIEKMEAVLVGSAGIAAGTINLKAAITGGGVTIGSIAATTRETFWAHHYVPTGKTCNLTSQWAGHTGTTVGSGATFVVRALAIGVANAVEQNVTDKFRLYGQSSSVQRNYGSPIKINGPARLTTYVTPETATSTNYRSSFDYYEQ